MNKEIIIERYGLDMLSSPYIMVKLLIVLLIRLKCFYPNTFVRAFVIEKRLAWEVILKLPKGIQGFLKSNKNNKEGVSCCGHK